MLNIQKDIIAKTVQNPLWSSKNDNIEYRLVCDWYGKSYWGDSVSDICNDIINDYGLNKKPKITQSNTVIQVRRNK